MPRSPRPSHRRVSSPRRRGALSLRRGPRRIAPATFLAASLLTLVVSAGTCGATPSAARPLLASGGFYYVEILQLALLVLVVLCFYLWQQRRLAERHARDLAQLNDALRHSQEALRQSEERFRQAFEAGPIGILLLNADSRILRANRALCQLLGYEETEILGWGLMDLAYPEDARDHLDRAQSLFRREPTQVEQELRFVTKEREVLWARVTSAILTGAHGTPICELSLIQDITHRKRAEQALRQLEERFSKAFHSSPVTTSISTLADGRFIDVNESFTDLTGYRRDEALGHTALALNLWEDPDQRARVIRELHEQGSLHNLEVRIRDRQGQSHSCLGAFDIVELNGERCLLTILHDITERKQAEEELRRSEERFQLIARATNDTVWDWDLTTNRVWWNEGIRTIFGYAADEVEHDADWWDQLIHPEDRRRVLEGLRQVIDSGTRFWSAEYRHRRADGSYAEVFDRAFVLLDPRGRPTRVLGAMMDITERNRFLKELATARDAAVEALRLKSEFLANISHEVRTPLNGILGMTVLLQDAELAPELRSYVDAIQSCTDQLLTIINDILDFSRIEAGKLPFESLDFDLRNTVETTVEILADRAQDKHIELVCLVDADVPNSLRGDPGRLRQVVTNLIVNAIKFTERGEVVLRAARESETDTHVNLLFTIRDTGIGIPKEAVPYLFQAFSQVDGSTTRKHGSTGLGLTISKQLVELMGGQIGVESTLGVGSTFWFTVRLEKQPGAATPLPPTPHTPQARVLIADDNEASRQLLTTAAQSLGLHSVAVASGHEALAQLRLGAATKQPFALAVLEMEMTDLDGLALGRTVKSDPALDKTRLILITPRSPQTDTALFRASGVSAILAKPIRQRNLVECMARLLDPTPQHETRFWLHRRTAPATSPIRPRIAARSCRVLVAEDNPINQRVTVALVEKLGYQTRAVASGPEVLRALESVPYDIILMDCQLPDMDGFEATRQIRRRERARPESNRPPVFIIAMTAFAQPGARQRCLNAGMNDYVSKPVRIETLTDVLTRALGQLQVPTAPETVAPPSPPSPSSEPPPLDLSAPDALRKLRTPHRPDPLTEVLDMFLHDVPDWIRQLDQTITRYESAQTRKAAHTLKGCASTLGANALASLCAQLEDQADKGSLQVARHLLAKVQTEFDRIRAYLEAHRHELLAPPLVEASPKSGPPDARS